MIYTHTHTHTHTFNGPFSGTTQVSRYQKGKTNLDFTEARDSEWQWHQLGHMQVCTLLQTDNHDSTPPLCFFTGRMPFLPPNQQCQSTEGNMIYSTMENDVLGMDSQKNWRAKYIQQMKVFFNVWHDTWPMKVKHWVKLKKAEMSMVRWICLLWKKSLRKIHSFWNYCSRTSQSTDKKANLTRKM